MKQRGIKVITVGFYLESFFYKQGFKIDRHYGGLVKKLNYSVLQQLIDPIIFNTASNKP